MKRFETYPANWKDRWVWPILLWLWTPLTRGKISFWWHWRPLMEFPRKMVEINNVDHKAKERTNWWRSFWLTNFGWQKVVILRPETTSQKYLLFFQGELRGWSRRFICSIVLDSPVAVLIGPNPVRFGAYAYDPEISPWDNPQEITLVPVQYSTRRELRRLKLKETPLI